VTPRTWAIFGALLSGAAFRCVPRKRYWPEAHPRSGRARTGSGPRPFVTLLIAFRESDKKTNTITSLAKILTVDVDQLNNFLQKPIVKLRQIFDISGFWSWRAGITGQPPSVVSVDLVDEDDIPGDKYSIEFTIGPRFPIRDIGRKAAQKLWNERGKIAGQLTKETVGYVGMTNQVCREIA
jgi:hypothetical protein